MVRPPIKALFLDAGKTLLTEREPRAVLYAQLAAEFGGQDCSELAQESMSRAFRELPQIIEGHFRFSLEWFRSFNGRVLGELGVAEARQRVAHDRAVAVFEDPATYRLYADVLPFLEGIRERGLVVGIVSNWSERLPSLCQGLGIADLVHFVIASADIKAEKPEREIFDRALFRAGAPGSETLHIGDHPQRDVKGALDAGLRAVLLHRDTAAPLASVEDVTIVNGLDELLPLLPAAEAPAPSV
jgi:REG-2-like HAD superfamily hydrolase